MLATFAVYDRPLKILLPFHFLYHTNVARTGHRFTRFCLSFSDVSCLPRDFSVSVSTNYCKFPVFLIRNSFVAAVRFKIASISNQVSGEKSTSPNANARTKQTHTHSIQSMSQHLFGSTSEFITCFVIKLPNHLKNNK